MAQSPITQDAKPEELASKLERLEAENKVYLEALEAVHAQCIRGRLFAQVMDLKETLWHTKVNKALNFEYTPENAKAKK